MSECLMCGNSKPNGYYLCSKCRKTYKKKSDWPPWLRELRNMHDRYNRSEVDTIPLDDEYIYSKLNTTGHSLRSRSDCDEASGMPLRPYGDERLDREYRRANGLKINI